MSRPAGAGYAFVCLVLLGAMPLLSAARPSEVPSLSFTVLVTMWQIISALPLTIAESRSVATRSRLPKGLRRRDWALAILTGAIFGLTTWMYIALSAKVGAVNFIILLQSYPLIASIMEFLVLGERRSRSVIVLTAVMIAAIAYLVSDGTFDYRNISLWSLAVLTIPVLWSGAHMQLRRILLGAQMTANQITLSRLVISVAFLLPVAVLTGEGSALIKAFTNGQAQAPAALFGIVYYLELLFWFLAMRHIKVSLASSITVPAPALTMAASFVILGETISAHQIIAMLAVAACLYGLLYVELRQKP